MSDEAEKCVCPDGIPAWVMTFSDLMSLLLAFFVLLFSFSEMDKNVYKEMAGSMKDAFGVQREIKAKEPPRGINIIAREFSPGKPQPTQFNEVKQSTSNDFQKFPVFTKATKEAGKGSGKGTSDNLKVYDKSVAEKIKQQQIKIDSEEIRKELKPVIDAGLIDMEVKHQGIVLRVREKASFSSGSANLIAAFKAISLKVATAFDDFEGEIVVSGHTDNIPIKTSRFRSNWELSSSRAVSVIHSLSSQPALKNKNYQVKALAETKPIDTNDTWQGRSKNRRVEIFMDYTNVVPDGAVIESPSPDVDLAEDLAFKALNHKDAGEFDSKIEWTPGEEPLNTDSVMQDKGKK